MNAEPEGSTIGFVPRRMARREAIKWMMTAAASAALLDPRSALAAAATPTGKGYGTDPDLLKDYKPGDLWPLTLTEAQRTTAAALCDTIIPQDGRGPAASSVFVHDFIDEWISAPYPGHGDDRTLIVEGLGWINAEAQKRFSADYANLVVRQKNAICDDICFVANAKPEFRRGAQFFKRFRDLTAGGYYTTPEGMKDIGYVGNVPLATFDGPPPEVLKKLGLA
jgi:hypothetical protein